MPEPVCDWEDCTRTANLAPAVMRLHEHDGAHPHHPCTQERTYLLCPEHTARLVEFVHVAPLHEDPEA